MSAPEIFRVGRSQLIDVARIHRLAFPASAMTRAGHVFVQRFYETQYDRGRGVIFLGARLEGELAGFACAGLLGDAIPRFIRANPVFIVRELALRPWITFDRRLVSRIAATVRSMVLRTSAAAQTVATPRCRLLAIATNPEMQGRGVGAALLASTESAARDLGERSIGLTVDPANTAALELYLRRGWVRLSGSDPWRGAMHKEL